MGGYICSILGRADPPIHVPNSRAQTHPCTKIFCSKPIQLPILFSFYCQTHPCTENSCSKPIHVPKFHEFSENDPPMSVHQPFKTHPCTKISRFFGKMTHPCTYIFVSKPIHVPRAYVSKKICEYPPGLLNFTYIRYDFSTKG